MHACNLPQFYPCIAIHGLTVHKLLKESYVAELPAILDNFLLAVPIPQPLL